MKSLEELEQIKEKAREEMKIREDKAGPRITIAMGTCGIAAGARETLDTILDELNKREINDVTISQTGCIGLCNQEPIIEVKKQGEDSVTYGKVGSKEAREIVTKHIVNDEVVNDLVIQ
ncbi:(2Fe-2S) ferredoxin domain-containing protein [Selenihalanaerobacter shriftii]|uniref:NAD(P)-dependent iron-only hydrogenase iron-sulfur protein n=1 Tax=Selenihalanaerobacter shriftii TaxID=142842 RepID=A0A1T4MK17_9FIRM|nr:(2Fe-2S) ferredoxin domain-containing protein [Selenihalanaerobacter shriftii]SJZ67332.1 NAD(P)-dependent iron-only hydrogenase iron-sulfur protein [Selenihalanaerobacter shriftii]